LREISQVLRSAIRPYDVCVRYAGDEFIIVLANCGAEEAESKRAELQEAVAASGFEAKTGVPMRLAISAGAAVFPHDGESYEALLAKADSRMYRDKVVRKREAKEHAPPPFKSDVPSDARAKAG
jgi:diguanylate cyclase (GGDEF)-like protein